MLTPSILVPPSAGSPAVSCRWRALTGTALALCLAAGVLVASASPATAAVTGQILRPSGDVVRQWTGTAGTAAAALDDPVIQPTPVTADDFIYGSVANNVTEVLLADVPLDGATAASTVWFYANTGPGTRLQVSLVSQGSIRSSLTLPASSPFAWRSMSVPVLHQADVNNARLRFTTLDAGNTNVRAAYLQLTTIYPPVPPVPPPPAPAPPPPFVDHIADLVFYEDNNLGGDVVCVVPVHLDDLYDRKNINFNTDPYDCGNDEARSVVVILRGRTPRFTVDLFNDSACWKPPDYARIQVTGDTTTTTRTYPRGLSFGSFERSVTVADGSLSYVRHDGALDGKVSCVKLGRGESASSSRGLKAGQWKKVVSGWGFFEVRYAVEVYTATGPVPGARYRCYPTLSGGSLPAVMTHSARIYGDCWLYSPVDANYQLTPVHH